MKTLRPPRWSWIPVLLIGAGIALPLAWILVRVPASDAGWSLVGAKRGWELAGRTGLLALAVLATVTALALPAAWLVTRTRLRFARLFTVLGLLPLAVPGYVLASAFLGLGGYQGLVEQWTGWRMESPNGFLGAWGALTLYTYPYMFLSLRTGYFGVDVAQEEAARALGHGRTATFVRITWPQIRAAWSAGMLLVVLHVFNDFGVTSLVGYETLNVAIHAQWDAAALGGQQAHAASLALVLLIVSCAVLLFDAWWLRTQIVRGAAGRGRQTGRPRRLGRGRFAAYGFLSLVPLFGLVLPLVVLTNWWRIFKTRPTPDPAVTFGEDPNVAYFENLQDAMGHSLWLAVPTALVALLVALPVAWLATRYAAGRVRLLERMAWFAHAVPTFALGLGAVAFALAWQRGGGPDLRDGLGLLVGVAALHYLAEALGPLKTSFLRASPRLEEAARALGATRAQVARRVTLPLVRPGVIAALAFVFLAAMKELNLVLLLAPLGFAPLSVEIWSYTRELMFAEAALPSLVILGFSGVLAGLLIRAEGRRL